MNYLNEKGNALFLTILAVVFVSVVSIGLLNVTANSNKITVNERFDQSLYYIAEADLNLEKAKLLSNIKTVNSNLLEDLNTKTIEEQDIVEEFFKAICPTTPLEIEDILKCEYTPIKPYSFLQQFDKKPLSKSKVSLFQDSMNSYLVNVIITSEGFFEGELNKKRNVEQSLTIDLNKALFNFTGGPINGGDSTATTLPEEIKDLALFTFKDMKISNNSLTLIGGGFLGSSDGIINPPKNDKTNLAERIKDIPSLKKDALEKVLFPEDKSSTLFKHEELTSNSITLDSDSYYKKLDLKKPLDININNNVTLYLDDFDGNPNGRINIIGSGKLNIVVKKTFNYKGSINSGGNPSKLHLYYLGENFSYSAGNANNGQNHNHSSLTGYLYIKSNNSTFNSGNITGAIYSLGNIEIISGVRINYSENVDLFPPGESNTDDPKNYHLGEGYIKEFPINEK